jgi:hypothetical protein
MVSRVNGRYIVVPHYLFSIEDGHLHYDAQVEQDHPRNNMRKRKYRNSMMKSNKKKA